MKNIKLLSAAFIALMTLTNCMGGAQHVEETADMELLAESGNIALYREIVDPGRDEFDVPVCALWLKDKSREEMSEILRSVRPERHCWYIADGSSFVEVPIDSIYAFSRAYIWNNEPLQIIVEGCPDHRNEFSYFVDVEARKAYWVPANNGFMGGAERDFMVFRSYRYVSDPEIAGRYSFLQVFNEAGEMVDSLNLEHAVLAMEKNRNNLP